MPAFDDFISEELEAPKRELMILLEQFYQQSTIEEKTISLAEQERILGEVRASLLTTNPAPEKHETRPLPVILPRDKEPAPPVQLLPVRSTGKRRLSHTARLLNTIAAVLAVAVLAAGSLILFTRLRTTTLHPKSPLSPPASCLPAQTIEGAGLDYLCTQHLPQDLHLVQGNNQYRVTLTKGYADQGQVLIWYQIAKKVNGQFQTVNPFTWGLGGGSFELTAPDGKPLKMGLGQPVNQAGIIGLSFSSRLGENKVENVTELEVKIHMSGIASLSPTIENIDLPLSFSFSLSAHGTWRSVSLQQTRVDHNHSLTLTGSGYSLSLVHIALKSPEPWFSGTYNAPTRPYSLPIVTSLKVGNVECILNPQSRFYQGAFAAQSYKGMQAQEPNGVFSQNINCSLASAGVPPGSEVTLVISMYSTKALDNTTLPASAVWTFHFPLP